MRRQGLFFTGRYENYSLQSFRKDLISGVVVGVIAIPLGMAFAIASGVKPEYGIYTTIIAGILISLLGGSKFQIGGPTGAFIPILFGIVSVYGFENLLIAGFMAGIMLFLMGALKLGSLIKFIPKPVTIGFTAGIAVIIFTGQLANFLGLTGVEKHEYFFSNIKEIFIRIDTINLYSIVTAVICLGTVLLTPKLFPKIPGPLIGLIVSTLAATLFFPGQVATIGSTYGEIPKSLPEFQIPEITLEKIQYLLKPAFIIAILGAIESLLSAVVADGMSGTRHNSNRELMGQGIANMITPFFGGIPATGALARTATNIKSGAVSPLSGIIHGFVVLLVLVLFAPFASKIPLASMAPILMVVAWNMSERHVFSHILKTKTQDSLILLVTFLLTVFVNLTVAVQAGLVLAVIAFLKQMSEALVTSKVLPDPNHKHHRVDSQVVTNSHDCPQISIFSVEGPLFFGAAQTFEQTLLNTINLRPKVLLLRLGRVPYMDTTGEAHLASIVNDFSKHGVVLISGIRPEPKELLIKTGLYDVIGEKHFFEHTGDAIEYAMAHLDRNACIGCRHLAFRECSSLSGIKEPSRAKGKSLPVSPTSREVTS
ncbi:sodium-independent anion transporter [Bacillus sp. FJAT-27225]|uniref:SulP family inorganic anion transporter n=1 Tax=Bacillus sp. FJAT-27225 TaxID=1743144 RepID=UPI00080C30BD|nr:SulP family inorganic anion transporter [Bacillus sp. FJAT-27225]OCA84400.1 sodium-independent anion transporter [Bacillus sp. FJAT-27225]